ncbi:MAG: hypothetical protein Kow0069_18580 [Promethearchaeota archaeon]
MDFTTGQQLHSRPNIITFVPDWKDLYGEVKRRKMAQAGKAGIVKKVEEAGRVLAIEGKYEKPKKVLKHCYAKVKEQIRPSDVPKVRLEDYDVVIVGCPGSDIPKVGVSKLRDYVYEAGGWLLSTDWVIRTILEYVFPGYVRWNGQKTDDVVIPCQVDDPSHPFLDGLQDIIGPAAKKPPWTDDASWTKKQAAPKKSSGSFSWWLEDRSFPVEVLNPAAVHVLVSSEELRRRWGAGTVLCYFDVGNRGGRVVHMISHTHLQRGKSKGKLVSAMILTNILDERVALKHGLKGKPPSTYVDPATGQPAGATGPVAGVWDEASLAAAHGGTVDPTTGEVTPDPALGVVPELTETSQVVPVTESLPATQKCALGDGNFEGYQGTILKCSKCGAPYHEACLNYQMQEGVCKICGRILLY